MILAVDIGNTNTTLGIFEDSQKTVLAGRWNMASDNKRTVDEYGITLFNLLCHAGIHQKIDGVIISSVVLPLTACYCEAIEKYLKIKPTVLSHKVNTGVKIALKTPSEVGADRIANAYAAFKLFKPPVIVIDFGTATSFDIVNKKGEFIGGIIAPGLKIQAECLSSAASRLPDLKIEAPKCPIGKNTIEAMLSGVVHGHSCMIDGMIEECEKELKGRATIVATGGYSSIISSNMKRKFDYLSPDLTLIGLKYLYELNN